MSDNLTDRQAAWLERLLADRNRINAILAQAGIRAQGAEGVAELAAQVGASEPDRARPEPDDARPLSQADLCGRCGHTRSLHYGSPRIGEDCTGCVGPFLAQCASRCYQFVEPGDCGG